MPNPLVTSVRIPMDSSSRPAGTPSAGTWLSGYAQKDGFRWKIGEDKTQVLAYSGTVWRSRLKTSGTPLGLLGWYYEPGGATADHYYSNGWSTSPPSYGASVWNRAYDRFKDVALGENATWGTTIAEGREALGLIGSRAFKLATAYRALRDGRFDRFCKELGIQPKRKHRRYVPRRGYLKTSVVREIARGHSALWLEYWFGWAPLAGEIYQSTLVLTTSQSSGKHWATASTKLGDQTKSFFHGGGSGKVVTERGKYMVKTGANVVYENYNHALVQQMGLANPLAIAWELVPFSFVVDWFTNVGDVLGAVTDFYGVRLEKAYTSEYLRTTSSFKTTWQHWTPSTWWEYSLTTHRSRRKLGIASPVLVRPKLANFGHSLTRAATAVSLLVQLFIKR